MAKAILFTSKDCSGCLEVKKLLKSNGVDWEKNVREVSIDTPEGSKLADKFDISIIPSVVDSDGVLCDYDEGIEVMKGTCKKCQE